MREEEKFMYKYLQHREIKTKKRDDEIDDSEEDPELEEFAT